MKSTKRPALSSWLLPALAFTLLYCILHYIYCNSGFNFTIPVIIICSLIPGFLLEPIQNLRMCRMDGNFFVQQGKKRRNTWCISSIFDAAWAEKGPFRRCARRS